MCEIEIEILSDAVGREEEMKRVIIFIVSWLPFVLPIAAQSDTTILYALDNAPAYNGPSKESGRFYFKPDAQKPLTLDKNTGYKVLDKTGGWIQVDVYGKTPWVETRYLIETLSQNNLESIYQERLESFNQIQSNNNRKNIYDGVSQSGKKLTFFVKDSWNNLSSDMKEAYVKDSFTLFIAMGGPRQIEEKPEDYMIEVRHQNSDRILATWDYFWGLKLKE